MLSLKSMPPLRFPLIKALPPALLALAFLSCDQDLNSSQDQPTIDYVVLATDSATSVPLDSVRVRVTTIAGDTSTYFTSAVEGRAQVATIASSRTLFELSRAGYATRDTIDTVNAKPDTVFHRPIPRLLRVRMSRGNGTDGGRIQVNILPRDADLNKLTRATAAYQDSLGDLRIVADTAGTGVIGLTALKVGKTLVLVKHPGYLGYKFEATVNGVSDTGRAASLVAILSPLGANSISGQVFQTTGSGTKPLLNARVEFHLMDSLAVPDTFVAFTSGDSAGLGRFEMDSVPALDGTILYFKDRSSREPVKTIAILKDEVLRDGPLALMTLTIASDSSLPFMTKAPGDSVRPNDSLVFQFNQRVDALEKYSVQLINQGPLLADTGWNTEHNRLRIWLPDGKWERGKSYRYTLSARNGAGQYFTAVGDTLRTVSGDFSVPDSVGSDSGLLMPKGIAFAYFNSGGYFLFNAADTNTCPFPDSSNQFARLRWGWNGTSGRKVDSLLVYYQDGGVTAANWTLWGALSGSADSATLVFADHYSTSLEPDPNKPPLPFKTGGRISFRVIPKHQGKVFADTTLDDLQQGMGPSVYSRFDKEGRVLKMDKHDTDSVAVSFVKSPTDPNSAIDWGASQPAPKAYLNEKLDETVAHWHWVDGKNGRVRYILPPVIDGYQVIRVDLNGVLFNGKPIWHRNHTQGFTLQ